MPPRHQGPRGGDSTATSFSITGWQGSKAANDPDGGAGALIKFLANKTKASINDWQQQGNAIMILVPAAESKNFARLDQYRFAGVTITVKEQAINSATTEQQPLNNTNPPSGPRPQNARNPFGNQLQQNGNRNNQNPRRRDGDNTMGGSPFNNSSPFNKSGPRPNASAETENIFQVLEIIIRERFNPTEKFLNLSALAQHPGIVSSGLAASSADKVFQALFVCCEERVWKTKQERQSQVESLSLASNALTTAKDVISAASTFYDIKNLDLSNNQIADVGELRYWSRRFRNLEHIIMSGNPCDGDANTRNTLMRWYHNLKFYNGQAISGSIQPPPPSASPAPIPPAQHPEFNQGSTFGVPLPDKPQDQLVKEQMGLKFSMETRLKMEWTEKVLMATNFDYAAAMALYEQESQNGNVPADALLM